MLFVDDAHAVGVIGKNGAGTPEHFNLHGQIDIISGTFGKALGGAVVDILQVKRNYRITSSKISHLSFSNSVPPSVVMASIKALDLLKEKKELLIQVKENAEYFRNSVKKLGFNVLDGVHPIVPIMLGDAKITQEFSKNS